jgi:hypothetical protein
MPTQKQIAANRRNAQKSTGPKTEQGKEIVSRNALTHGLQANKAAVLPGEEEAFANFAGAMIADLAPEGVFEHLEVNKLIHATWRSLRLNHIETGVLTDAILKEQEKRRAALAAGGPAEPAFEEQHQAAIQIGRAYLRASPAISTLARYRVKLDREAYKALDQFRTARYARVCMWDPHYVANLKRFNPPADDSKKADRNPNARRD